MSDGPYRDDARPTFREGERVLIRRTYTMTKPKLETLLKAYISQLRDEAARMSTTCAETRVVAVCNRRVANDLEVILDKREVPKSRIGDDS